MATTLTPAISRTLGQMEFGVLLSTLNTPAQYSLLRRLAAHCPHGGRGPHAAPTRRPGSPLARACHTSRRTGRRTRFPRARAFARVYFSGLQLLNGARWPEVSALRGKRVCCFLQRHVPGTKVKPRSSKIQFRSSCCGVVRSNISPQKIKTVYILPRAEITLKIRLSKADFHITIQLQASFVARRGDRGPILYMRRRSCAK